MADLKDYPCFYFMSQKAAERDICKHASLIMYMHGLSFDEMEEKSKFLCIVSDGRIKNYVTKTDAEKLVKEFQSNDANKVPSCQNIQKLRYSQKYKLRTNCCFMCPLSYNYVCGYIDQERAVLKYILSKYSKDTTFLTWSSTIFTAIVSVGRCNDVVRYPYVPFNAMLFDQILACFMGGVKDISTDTISDKMYNSIQTYIAQNFPQNAVSEAQLRTFIATELELIDKAPLLTKSDYIDAKKGLAKREPYVPVSVLRAAPEKPLPEETVIGRGANSEKPKEGPAAEAELRRKPVEKARRATDMWASDDALMDSVDAGWDDIYSPSEKDSFAPIPADVFPAAADTALSDCETPTSGTPAPNGGAEGDSIAEETTAEVPSEDVVKERDVAAPFGIDGAPSSDHGSDEQNESPEKGEEKKEEAVSEETEMSDVSAEDVPAEVTETPDRLVSSDARQSADNDEDEAAEPKGENGDAVMSNEDDGGYTTLSSSDGSDMPGDYPTEDDLDCGLLSENILDILDEELSRPQEDDSGSSYYRMPHNYEKPCTEVYSAVPYISDRFESFIIAVGDDIADSLDIVSDSVEAGIIPIEYVRLRNHEGFLMFVQKRFYFLDIDKVSDKLFMAVYGDHKGIRFISLNPVRVYAGMRRLGISYRPILSLSMMYRSAYEFEALPSLDRIFDMIVEDAPVEKGKIRRIDKDALWLVMPRYEEVYEHLRNDHMLDLNKKVSKYEWAISKSCDLSLFLDGGRNYVSGGNALTAEINLSKPMLLNSVKTEGSLISITVKAGNKGIIDMDFWKTVAGNLSMMDTPKTYAYMIGISESGLSYYVCDFVESFYDRLLYVIRTASVTYQKAMSGGKASDAAAGEKELAINVSMSKFKFKRDGVKRAES